jgi:pimeloyl-ACP methyl ester carboxylesterase
MTVKLQHPVVLINGLIFPQSVGVAAYYPQELLTANCDFHLLDLPPWATQKERLLLLADLFQKLQINSCHVIGHSQGGIDGRWLLEDPEFRKKILTLTSINSPFRGTPVLDYFFWLKKNWSHFYDLQTHCWKAQDHTPHFCVNSYIKSADDLKHMPLFRFISKKLQTRVGKNDGFLSLESMRLGEEILLADADHLASIGWPLNIASKILGARHPNYFFQKIFDHLKEWEFKR